MRTIRELGLAGNGTDDDTLALRTAFSQASGGVLHLPAGTYRVNVNSQGDSPALTLSHAAVIGNGVTILASDTAYQWSVLHLVGACRVEGIAFADVETPTVPRQRRAIYVTPGAAATLARTTFARFREAIKAEADTHLRAEHCVTHGGAMGVLTHGRAEFISCDWRNMAADAGQEHAIYSSGPDLDVESCHFSSLAGGGYAVHRYGGEDGRTDIMGSTFERCNGVYVDGNFAADIVDSRFNECGTAVYSQARKLEVGGDTSFFDCANNIVLRQSSHLALQNARLGLRKNAIGIDMEDSAAVVTKSDFTYVESDGDAPAVGVRMLNSQINIRRSHMGAGAGIIADGYVKINVVNTPFLGDDQGYGAITTKAGASGDVRFTDSPIACTRCRGLLMSTEARVIFRHSPGGEVVTQNGAVYSDV